MKIVKKKLYELFTSQNGDFDIKQEHINDRGIIVCSSGENNQGIIGKTDIKAKVIKGNSITVDMFGNVFYRDFDYKIVTHARIFTLEGQYSKNTMLYLTASLKYLKKIYSYNDMCSWNKIKDREVPLPSKDGKTIDFEYIDSYITELEYERITELDKYLSVSGLNNYNLTDEDSYILSTHHYQRENQDSDVKYKKFKIEEFLNWQPQKEIDPLKIPKLTTNNVIKYPFYGQATINNGVISYLSLNEKVLNNKESKPTILIHSNNQGIVYLETPFYLKDGHGATSVLQSDWLNEKNAQYLITSIKKVIVNKYSYNEKATKIALKNTYIELPVDSNGEIDYKYMEKYIEAIEKKVIKDVVDYKDKVINKTKEVVY